MEAMSNWFNDKEHPDNASKRNLLREVFKVAKVEESYRNGEIGAYFIVLFMPILLTGYRCRYGNPSYDRRKGCGRRNRC
jgi:Cft2 family RNA processing exonuclease